MQILSIIESAPWPVVTQALYFSGRALLHAPHTTSYEDSLVYDFEKGYTTPDGIALAQHLLRSICEAESVSSVGDLSETTIASYMRQASIARDTLRARYLKPDPVLGAELLRRMREDWLTP